MGDMYDKLSEYAIQAGTIVKDLNGEDVAILDMRSLSMWTDFFIIATVTSSPQRGAIQRQVAEWARKEGLDLRNYGKKAGREDEWTLIDLGQIVIHLMSGDLRSFYDLERLWARATRLPLKGAGGEN